MLSHALGHDHQLLGVGCDEHSAFSHPSYPEYLDYRDRNEVFEGLAAYTSNREILSAAGASGPATVEYVSRDFFEVLRVDAALGRTFLPDEGQQPGDAAVVVLSHRAWQNRFGADPSVVGRVVRLGTTAHSVIGVTPESIVFTDQMFAPELYAPITRMGLVGGDRGDPLTDRNRESFWLMGRLRSGVTVAQARVNLSVLTTALATAYPDSMEHSELWVEAGTPRAALSRGGPPRSAHDDYGDGTGVTRPADRLRQRRDVADRPGPLPAAGAGVARGTRRDATATHSPVNQ